MATDRTSRLMERYARFLSVAGPLLVGAALLTDSRWTQSLGALLTMTLGVTLLRSGPVRLSKFSYLTQTGVPALVAAFAAPPSHHHWGTMGSLRVMSQLGIRKA